MKTRMPATRQLPPERLAGLPKLPDNEQFAGPLDGVPRIYRHAKCGVETEMPEEVIRSYLADPWMYNDWVWCCGCEDNIRQQDLTWTESSEPLDAYFARLKESKSPPRSTYSLIREPLIFGMLGLAIGLFSGSAGLGAGIGLAFGVLLVVARRLGMR
jgi:hypothetical protein